MGWSSRSVLNRSKSIRPMLALAFVVISITTSASAAPNLNNVSNDVQQVQAEIQTDRQQVEAPKVKERIVKPTWRDNPKNCTDKQWIAKEPPFTCIDKPLKPSDSQQTQSVELSKSKEELMRLAGIPEHEWAAVNEIITRESGWKHTIWNSTGSGAYGLCQSLPASKMSSAGADYMTNPVTQLKWCNEYAKGYGGWNNAASYSRCIGNCYSHRVKTYVYKDHKWW